MDTRIRPATRADLDTIVEFNRRLALETEHKALDTEVLRSGVGALLSNPEKGRYFIAETDAGVVGQIMVTGEWSDWRNGSFWWIQSVYVAENCRGQGIFTALFRHVEAEARQQSDVCGLRLYVDNLNLPAQAAYRGCGMTMTDYRIMELDRSGAVRPLEHAQ